MEEQLRHYAAAQSKGVFSHAFCALWRREAKTQDETVTIDRKLLAELDRLLWDAYNGIHQLTWDDSSAVMNPLDEACGLVDELLKDGE